MRAGRALSAAAAALVLLAACGDDDASVPAVPVGEIDDAIAAVESTMGGPQQFSEVNATPSEVNVFVVRAGEELAYVVRDDVVEPPPAGVTYSGATFGAGDVAFTPQVLDQVASALPDSEIVAFSITPGQSGGPGDVVEYIATVRATGGELRVLLDADGNVLAVA